MTPREHFFPLFARHIVSTAIKSLTSAHMKKLQRCSAGNVQL
jgi:hypothetical protein